MTDRGYTPYYIMKTEVRLGRIDSSSYVAVRPPLSGAELDVLTKKIGCSVLASIEQITQGEPCTMIGFTGIDDAQVRDVGSQTWRALIDVRGSESSFTFFGDIVDLKSGLSSPFSTGVATE